MTTPFEKAGAVSIPYGSNADFSWIAIWEVDMRSEIQAFIQSMTRMRGAGITERSEVRPYSQLGRVVYPTPVELTSIASGGKPAS